MPGSARVGASFPTRRPGSQVQAVQRGHHNDEKGHRRKIAGEETDRQEGEKDGSKKCIETKVEEGDP